MLYLLSPRFLRNRLKSREPLARLIDYLTILVVLCVGLGVSYRVAERASWGDSWWLVWQTVSTVGYGDMPPKSALGRLGTALFGLSAIIFLAPAISAAFEYRQDYRDRKRRGMIDNPHREGYVLFNFPGRDSCLAFLRQLRTVEPETPVCIVDSALEALPPSVTDLGHVHFVRGSLLERQTYERAGLRHCRAVIVYPADRTRSDADGTTRTLVEMVQSFVSQETRIIHILLDPDHEWLFEGCRSSGLYADMESLALVQELQGRYTALALEHLLLNTHGADPCTVHLRRIDGWTWRDLRRLGVQAMDNLGISLNWLALVQDGTPETCPANNTRLRAGDALIVTVAHGSRLDWEAFESELLRCKSGQPDNRVPEESSTAPA